MKVFEKIQSVVRMVLEKIPFTSAAKRGYHTSWKPKSNGYGKTEPKKMKWFAQVLNKISWPFLRKKGRSYLSRAEKRKMFAMKMGKSAAVTGVVLLLLLGLKKPVEHIASSLEFFYIKDIAISGCRNTQTSELKSMADIDYNKSLFSIAPKKVKAVLVSHPWIKSVQVKKQWPDGIHIQVLEHQIHALLVKGPSGKEKSYYLNKQGGIIVPVEAGQEIDYPVITGIDGLAEVDQEEVLQDAISFIGLIGKSDPNLPAQSVSEVHLDKTEGIVVYLVDYPFPIYFGKGEVKKKYRQLRKILAVLYKKRKRNMDISNIKYIRMNYSDNKVLVAQTESG